MNPTFDNGGYPAEETLAAIDAWPHADQTGWFAYIREAWNKQFGSVRQDFSCASLSAGEVQILLITGGWSGNEAIISAMKENSSLWELCWESSHRGGLHVFIVPGGANGA